MSLYFSLWPASSGLLGYHSYWTCASKQPSAQLRYRKVIRGSKNINCVFPGHPPPAHPLPGASSGAAFWQHTLKAQLSASTVAHRPCPVSQTQGSKAEGGTLCSSKPPSCCCGCHLCQVPGAPLMEMSWPFYDGKQTPRSPGCRRALSGQHHVVLVCLKASSSLFRELEEIWNLGTPLEGEWLVTLASSALVPPLFPLCTNSKVTTDLQGQAAESETKLLKSGWEETFLT